jgi:alanine transaminase
MKKYFSSATREKVITMKTMSQNLIRAQYQVRGATVIRADEIRKEIESGKKYPFDEFVYWNVGNPHNLGQPPISFPREVIGCVLGNHVIKNYQNKDAMARAKIFEKYTDNVSGYTDYLGIKEIRENCAKFIEQRDGHPSNYKNIFTSNGTSGGIKTVLQALLTPPNGAVLVPIPQYPLYSASIDLLGCHLAGYYLNEEKNWSVDSNSLEKAYKINRDLGRDINSIVVINPGNPTGQLLSAENIAEIIKFAYDRKLFILADEVYQGNIYTEKKKFVSFKKVLSEIGYPYNQVPIASFHSVSKGNIGECGMRGGYTELTNVPDKIRDNILKIRNFDVSPNLVGQIILDCLINPPNLTNASAETMKQFDLEVSTIREDLKAKALIMTDRLNKIPNVQCQEIEGAMYAFPKINFPQKFIDAAKKKNMEPDLIFCMQMLEEKGIVCVPGSGFVQEEGTHHFRLTNLLCPKSRLERDLEKVRDFTLKFFEKYSSKNVNINI